MHDLRRKLLSLGNHFFERLKTANFSTACGTSTLKSLPSRAFFVSDVHLRPRKHFSRCTLDCGFKTAETPHCGALRPGRGRLRLRPFICAKIERPSPLEKPSCKVRLFAQNRSRKYCQKVTATTPSQTAFHRIFSASRTNGPHSLSQVKAGTHSAFGEGSHTAAYTPKQGAFRMGVVSLPSERSARSPTSPGRVSERQVLPLLGLGRGCSQKTQKAFGTAMRLCASLFRGVAAPLGCVICLQLGDVAVFSLCAQYFLNVRGGGGITTLGAFHTVRKPCVAGV